MKHGIFAAIAAATLASGLNGASAAPIERAHCTTGFLKSANTLAKGLMAEITDAALFKKGFKVTAAETVDGACKLTFQLSTGSNATTIAAYAFRKNDGKAYNLAFPLKGLTTISRILSDAPAMPFSDVGVRNPVIMIVPRANAGLYKKADFPQKAVYDTLEVSTKEWDVSHGVNLIFSLEGSPSGIVKPLFEAVGLASLDGWVVRGVFSTERKVVLRKKTDWVKPFGWNGAKIAHPNISISLKPPAKFSTANLTKLGKDKKLRSSKNKAPQNMVVSAWGKLMYRSKDYFILGQVQTKPKAKAFAFDAREITLQDFVNLSALMRSQDVLKNLPDPTNSITENLPLGIVKIENKKFNPFDGPDGAVPDYGRMMIVAATPGTELPGNKSNNKTSKKSILDKVGRTGPLLFANGTGTVMGQKLANVAVAFSLKGINLEADAQTPKLGPMPVGGATLRLGPTDSKKPYGNHRLSLTGKVSLAGLQKVSARIDFDLKGVSFKLPANCPLQPISISATTPSAVNLASSALDMSKLSMDLDVGFKDCFSDQLAAIAGDTAALAGDVANFSADTAEKGGEIASDALRNLGNVMPKLDGAWDAAANTKATAQAAVNAAKSTVGKIGGEITKLGGQIKDLGNDIKNLLKKIFSSGISALKREKKKKQAVLVSKKAQKKTAERRLARARNANKNTPSPYFAPGAAALVEERNGLMLEQATAVAMQTLSKNLGRDFANKTKRKKMLDQVDAAPFAEDVAKQAKALAEKAPTTLAGMIKKKTDLNTQVAEIVSTGHRNWVGAAYETALDAKLARANVNVLPPAVYIDKPARIVSHGNAKCLQLNLVAGKGQRGGLGSTRSPNTGPLFNDWGSTLNESRGAMVVAPCTDKAQIVSPINGPSYQTRTISTQKLTVKSDGRILGEITLPRTKHKVTVCGRMPTYTPGATAGGRLCSVRDSSKFFYHPTRRTIRAVGLTDRSNQCLQYLQSGTIYAITKSGEGGANAYNQGGSYHTQGQAGAYANPPGAKFVHGMKLRNCSDLVKNTSTVAGLNKLTRAGRALTVSALQSGSGDNKSGLRWDIQPWDVPVPKAGQGGDNVTFSVSGAATSADTPLLTFD